MGLSRKTESQSPACKTQAEGSKHLHSTNRDSQNVGDAGAPVRSAYETSAILTLSL